MERVHRLARICGHNPADIGEAPSIWVGHHHLRLPEKIQTLGLLGLETCNLTRLSRAESRQAMFREGSCKMLVEFRPKGSSREATHFHRFTD